jgi:hypothetical protein
LICIQSCIWWGVNCIFFSMNISYMSMCIYHLLSLECLNNFIEFLVELFRKMMTITLWNLKIECDGEFFCDNLWFSCNWNSNHSIYLCTFYHCEGLSTLWFYEIH